MKQNESDEKHIHRCQCWHVKIYHRKAGLCRALGCDCRQFKYRDTSKNILEKKS